MRTVGRTFPEKKPKPKPSSKGEKEKDDSA